MSSNASESNAAVAVPGPSTDVEKDLDQFLTLLRAVRDRLPQPDRMTWKVVYEDPSLQASQFAERMSSCLLTAKVRKFVRYAAPRLVIGQHDDVVITILLEGSTSVLSQLVGAKAQERHQERLDRHEASKQTKVELRRAAIQRTKQRVRESGRVSVNNAASSACAVVIGSNAEGADIVEEVEEVEEIEEVEEDEEGDAQVEGGNVVEDAASGGAALTPSPPPEVRGASGTNGDDDDDDVPPPPGPPPPLIDSSDAADPPPPPADDADGGDESWDAPPPPPPPPPLVGGGDDWDDVPPPPEDDDDVPPPPPPPPLVDDGQDDEWDVPPPPPPPE